MRAGKGFLTIEQPRRLKEAAKKVATEKVSAGKVAAEGVSAGKIVLLECMSNPLPTKCFQKKICLL